MSAGGCLTETLILIYHNEHRWGILQTYSWKLNAQSEANGSICSGQRRGPSINKRCYIDTGSSAISQALPLSSGQASAAPGGSHCCSLPRGCLHLSHCRNCHLGFVSCTLTMSNPSCQSPWRVLPTGISSFHHCHLGWLPEPSCPPFQVRQTLVVWPHSYGPCSHLARMGLMVLFVLVVSNSFLNKQFTSLTVCFFWRKGMDGWMVVEWV